MIYLDSSAILKLVQYEAETHDLQTWLSDRSGVALVTSELGRVEVLRIASKVAGTVGTAEARAVLADVDLIPLSRGVQDVAIDLSDSTLRTLDALHLASAVLLGSLLDELVTYDLRLATAARAHGLVVVSPGQSAD